MGIVLVLQVSQGYYNLPIGVLEYIYSWWRKRESQEETKTIQIRSLRMINASLNVHH